MPLQAAGVDGVISVQARQSLEETHWLFGSRTTTHLCAEWWGGRRWFPDHVKHDLETVVADPKLRGCGT